MPEQSTVIIMRTVVTFLGGSIAGAFINNRFSISREKRARKREFYEWLTEWKSNVDYTTEGNEIAREFWGKRSAFMGKAAVIEQDLAWWRKKRFKRAVSSVADMNGGRTADKKDQASECNLSLALKAVMKFCR